jgi:predicted dehydrogenase
MLRRGYHVMSEKPMSLTYADCCEMLEAAKGAKGQLAIGQCVRFYPSYQYLMDCVKTEKYGKVVSGDFYRLSTTPDWGFENWFLDTDKSGGCITDLHVHDIDIIRHIFGEPKAITALATHNVARYDSCHTTLHYEGFDLFAVGDWSLTKRPFEAGFRVSFEHATLTLERNGDFTLFPRDGGDPESIELPAFNAYANEIAYLCDVIEGKTENLLNTPASAARSIYLTERIKESADSRSTVTL